MVDLALFGITNPLFLRCYCWSNTGLFTEKVSILCTRLKLLFLMEFFLLNCLWCSMSQTVLCMYIEYSGTNYVWKSILFHAALIITDEHFRGEISWRDMSFWTHWYVLHLWMNAFIYTMVYPWSSCTWNVLKYWLPKHCIYPFLRWCRNRDQCHCNCIPYENALWLHSMLEFLTKERYHEVSFLTVVQVKSERFHVVS